LALVVATVAWGGMAGCGAQCDARIAVEAVVLKGSGREIIPLELSARVTIDGRGAPGVDVVFEIGWPPDGSGGRNLGSGVTDSDGIARLHVSNAVGPYSAFGTKAAEWTKYRAEPSLIQSSDSAAKAVCAGRVEAPFRFEP
jgi:hypothetical protein